MGKLDVVVFEWLNLHIAQTPGVIEIAYVVADYAPIAVACILIMYFVTCRQDKTHVRATVLLAGLSALLSLITVDAIASEVYRPRPFNVLEHSSLLIPQFDDSSFPSMDAAYSAAIALVMFRVPNKAIRWGLVAIALLVGLARPVLGDHWPSDVLGSFAIGVVLAYVSLALAHPLTPITTAFLGAVQRAEDHLLH